MPGYPAGDENAGLAARLAGREEGDVAPPFEVHHDFLARSFQEVVRIEKEAAIERANEEAHDPVRPVFVLVEGLPLGGIEPRVFGRERPQSLDQRSRTERYRQPVVAGDDSSRDEREDLGQP